MQVGHTFYHCSREREANVFDHKGCNSNGTNEECCLLMRLRHQPKQSLDRGTIFMRGCLSLCCPARPGTFLITIQSLSVYTISGAEWTVAQGSPWEALEAPPCPAFSLPPPSLPPSQTVHAASPNNPTPAHTHKHTHSVMEPPPLSHTHQLKPWESVLLLSASYLWQILRPFVADHSTIRAPSAVLKAEVLHMGHVSSCWSVKAWALKKGTY